MFYEVKKQHISLIEAITEGIEWNAEEDDIAKFQKYLPTFEYNISPLYVTPNKIRILIEIEKPKPIP